MRNKSVKLFFRLSVVTAVLAGAALFAGGCNSEAKQYYEEALEYSSAGDYDMAVESFEKAIAEDSDKAEYYIDYGFTLIEMENYSEAITQFNKTILSSDENIVDPDNKITRSNNKKAYRGKAIAYFENHDYENAIKFFEYALEINEENGLNDDIRSYLADAKKYAGDYEGAIEAYEEIIDKSKETAGAYAGIAECQALLGNYEKAIEAYDKAIKEDSNDYSFYIGKYNLYVAMNDTQNANQTIEDALSIKDTSDESVLYKGELYYMTGEIEKAHTCLKQALEAGLDEAGFYLGRICLITENDEDAITYFENYIASDAGRKSAAAYKELAALYMDNGSYDKAEDIVSAGIALNDAGYAQSFMYFEIVIAERQGDFEKAFEKALQYCNDYPDDEKMKEELSFLGTRNNTGQDDNADSPDNSANN